MGYDRRHSVHGYNMVHIKDPDAPSFDWASFYEEFYTPFEEDYSS